jgi:hypothetical protein
MAFKTKKVFMVTEEQELQVNIKLKAWKELGLKVSVVLEKIFSFNDDQPEAEKGLIQILHRKSKVNHEKVKAFAIISERLQTEFTEKQNNETSGHLMTIEFEPLQTEREVLQPRIEKLYTGRNQLILPSHVTAEILSSLTDFVYHQQALTNLELVIDHYAEQIAHHVHEAAAEECPLDSNPGVDWVTSLINKNLHWPDMTIQRPCFYTDSWVTEFAIHAFPFQQDENNQKNELTISRVWVTKGNLVYNGIPELLQEYDEALHNIFWIPAVSGEEIPVDVRSIVTETPNTQECRSEVIADNQPGQVLPLGKSEVMFYTSKAAVLYFNCGPLSLTKGVETGIIHVRLDSDCKFMYPSKAEIINIDVTTAEIQYKYVPIPAASEEQEKNDIIGKYLTNKYLIYAACVAATLSITGCLIWNIKSLRCIFSCLLKRCNQRSQQDRQEPRQQAIQYSAPSAPMITYAFQMM